MQPSLPPIVVALFGVITALFVTSATVRWIARTHLGSFTTQSQSRRHLQQYEAARTLLIVQFTFARLSEDQQTEVVRRVNELLLLSGVDAYVFRPNSPVLVLLYALTMKTLGIQPAIAGEPWGIPEVMRLPVVKPSAWRLGPPWGMSSLMRRSLGIWRLYSRGGQGADDARRDLSGRGLDIGLAEANLSPSRRQ